RDPPSESGQPSTPLRAANARQAARSKRNWLTKGGGNRSGPSYQLRHWATRTDSGVCVAPSDGPDRERGQGHRSAKVTTGRSAAASRVPEEEHGARGEDAAQRHLAR